MVIISMRPEYQMGYHLWDIRPQILYGKMKAAQMGMATQLLFTAIVTLMKVAILLTYLRIFPSKVNRWFCRIMLFYTVSLNVSCFFVTLFQCSPANTYWEIFKYSGRARCLNIKAIYYFHSAQNTLSDFIIFLWPAKDLLNVHVSRRQRITLTCMFSLGIIVCIAGVVRIYYTHMYLISYDVFWEGGQTFIIMSVEGGVGVACGCLPGCKPLMNRMFPRIFANPSQSSAYRRPSARDRFKKIGVASSSTICSGPRQKESFKLQSLSSDDKGMMVKENGRDMKVEKHLPRRPSIPPPGLQVPSRIAVAQNSGRRQLGVLDDVSDGSNEFIILQQNAADSKY
ncbi:hypothetical protein EJ02DRAFT_345760 [Clathrospora elynae]|uniref:Rhodopsin domain-containing protein n=1 Tax=Clathrospora elynae TaxID=706981 RepID=A0A6A5SNW3_9PLEO|nr:hypothetical protein EJ02DRAFT_345760 [Clathrospora elynae]